MMCEEVERLIEEKRLQITTLQEEILELEKELEWCGIRLPKQEFEDYKRLMSMTIVLNEDEKKKLLMAEEVRVVGEKK